MVAQLGSVMQPQPQNVAPEPQQQNTPPASPEEFESLRQGWLDFFASPEFQAGALQFGVGMLQPVGWGQTQRGNLGLAIADAGGAVGRVKEQRMLDDQNRLGAEKQERELADAERRTQVFADEETRRGADAAADRALEERRLNEYLIPSLTPRGGSGGGADNTRNGMLKNLVTQGLKAQAEAAAVGDEFDMDAYIDNGVAAIDRALGMKTGTTGEGGPTASGLPDIADVTDEDIIDVYANGTAEEQQFFEKQYGQAWIDRKNKLLAGKKAAESAANTAELEQERTSLLEQLKTAESGILKQQINDRLAEIEALIGPVQGAMY